MPTDPNQTDLEEQVQSLQQEIDALRAEHQDFLYAVSHDLSAPLRAIDGFSTLILKKQAGNFDESTLQHFKYVLKGTDDAKAILEGLLIYSRLNTQKLPFETCDLNETMKDVMKSLRDTISEKNATVTIDTLPSLNGDARQLSQLFYQILKNALLYHPEGGDVQVSISAKEEQSHWLFSISDNGIGIGERAQTTIFKALSRAASHRDYSGVGMGLAIAKKIVLRHGGGIWVESQVGQGSTFHFNILKGLLDERSDPDLIC